MASLQPPVEIADAWSSAAELSYPLHRHAVAELVFHRSGAGTVQTPEGALHFGPGSVVHCPPRCEHGEHHDDGQGRLVVVQLRWRGRPPAGMERPWVSAPGSDPWLAGEFAWLGSDAWRRDEGHRREAACRALAAVAHLLAGSVEAPAPVRREPDRRVAEAERWIRAHLAAASVAAVAAAMGAGPDHCNRLFRAHRDYGPRTAIALARIDRAKRLLADGDLPLEAVAADIGFASARHFCAAFRRLVGTTPAAFRRGAR